MTERVSDYNVFISWSGELSKKIARTVQDWLSVTIQIAKPFVSEKDIDAGDRGLQEIEHQLDKVKVGIFCLTSQNLKSPWLHFEAGAVSKKFGDKSYVIPLLFDVESHQVTGPLAQFQWKRFTQEDMAAVARTVNKSLGNQVDSETLTTSLEWAWTRLEGSIEQIRLDASQQELFEQPKRTADDMLEEVVVTLREHSQVLNNLEVAPPRQTILDHHLGLTTDVLKKTSRKTPGLGSVPS